MRIPGLLVLLALLMPGVSTGQAQTASAQLDDAIAAWLAGDDASALPALSELAHAGNRDARLLLGTIARRAPSDWVANLERKRRNALLRAPGGLSGRSWLKVLADDGDLHALALDGADRPPFDFVKIQALMEFGETETAIRFVLELVNRGVGAVSPEFATLPRAFGRDGAYAAYRPLIAFHVIKDFGLKGDPSDPAIWTADALILYGTYLRREQQRAPDPVKGWLAILRGDPVGARIEDAEQIGQIIDRSPPGTRNLRAARRFCERQCPADGNRCLATVTVMQQRGFDGLWDFASPANAVIDPEAYYNSDRAIVDVRRSIAIRRAEPGSGSYAVQWADRIACLAD